MYALQTTRLNQYSTLHFTSVWLFRPNLGRNRSNMAWRFPALFCDMGLYCPHLRLSGWKPGGRERGPESNTTELRIILGFSFKNKTVRWSYLPAHPAFLSPLEEMIVQKTHKKVGTWRVKCLRLHLTLRRIWSTHRALKKRRNTHCKGEKRGLALCWKQAYGPVADNSFQQARPLQCV